MDGQTTRRFAVNEGKLLPVWIALDSSTFSVRLFKSGLTLRGLEKSRRQKIQ